MCCLTQFQAKIPPEPLAHKRKPSIMADHLGTGVSGHSLLIESKILPAMSFLFAMMQTTWPADSHMGLGCPGPLAQDMDGNSTLSHLTPRGPSITHTVCACHVRCAAVGSLSGCMAHTFEASPRSDSLRISGDPWDRYTPCMDTLTDASGGDNVARG